MISFLKKHKYHIKTSLKETIIKTLHGFFSKHSYQII
jgi:hypothetical protein